MFIFWLALAACCIIAYLFLEWKISNGAIKSIAQKEAVCLPGRKRNYIILAGTLSLLGYFGIYIALISYYSARIQLVCIGAGLLIAMVNVIVTASGLKYLAFEEDERDR